jgi:hypothetical protein
VAVTLVVATTFIHLSVIIYFFCFLLFLRYPDWVYSNYTILKNNLLRLFPEEGHSSLISFSIVEMISTLIYMLSAFICMQFGLANSDDGVTSKVLIRWFIESYSYMMIIGIVFYEFCFEEDNITNRYPFYTICGIYIKVSLFISMRYAEYESNTFANDIKVLFFKIFCKLD